MIFLYFIFICVHCVPLSWKAKDCVYRRELPPHVA
uniref:Uncharacterized protein n=1 Tax=Arundo donax TaxID=35708 RepID=A0A0A9BZ51_ARUDO